MVERAKKVGGTERERESESQCRYSFHLCIWCIDVSVAGVRGEMTLSLLRRNFYPDAFRSSGGFCVVNATYYSVRRPCFGYKCKHSEDSEGILTETRLSMSLSTSSDSIEIDHLNAANIIMIH